MSACVYRMYDANGGLLYIGATQQLPGRLENHRTTKHWFSEIATVTIEHFATWSEALAAEAAAIRAENPPHERTEGSGRKAWMTRRARQEANHAAGARCFPTYGCVDCNAARKQAVAS